MEPSILHGILLGNKMWNFNKGSYKDLNKSCGTLMEVYAKTWKLNNKEGRHSEYSGKNWNFRSFMSLISLAKSTHDKNTLNSKKKHPKKIELQMVVIFKPNM